MVATQATDQNPATPRKSGRSCGKPPNGGKRTKRKRPDGRKSMLGGKQNSNRNGPNFVGNSTEQIGKWPGTTARWGACTNTENT